LRARSLLFFFLVAFILLFVLSVDFIESSLFVFVFLLFYLLILRSLSSDIMIYNVHCLSLLGTLLGEKDGMDVGEDTSGSDGNTAKKLVELLIVLDGKSQVTRDDARLLVVTGSIASELEDLSSEVLKDSGHVDTSSHTDTVTVVTLLHVTSHTSDRELKACLGGGRGGGALSAAALSSSDLSSLSGSLSCSLSRHDDSSLVVFSDCE
jgi:hypothetical protein